MRSGTTLVRAMLDAHPQMAVPGESRWLSRLAVQPELVETSPGRLDPEALVRHIVGSPAYAFERRWDMNQDDVLMIVKDAGTFPDAARALFAEYARRLGKRRYADKTPGSVLAIDELAKAFPEMHFVHVVRDGRDVALSFLETSFGPNDVGTAAIEWTIRVRAGRQSGRVLGPSRYSELRYEALVADPESQLSRLCATIGLPFTQAMLGYTCESDRLLSQVLEPGSHAGLRSPPTTGMRDWTVQLPAADQELFESVAGDLLDELGYPRLFPRPGLAARAEAARLHSRARVRQAKRRLAALARSGTSP